MGIELNDIIDPFNLFGTKDKDKGEDTSAADKLAAEEEEKSNARRQALADLNPTGTLGAGSASTTRSQTLGV